MARMTNKICLVCGKEVMGTESKLTCSTSCRTALSRMIAKGKKPEFWLIAKGKGQKIPSFKPQEKKKVIKEVAESIEYLELPPDILESPLANFVPTENMALTKEQVEAKINELTKQISVLERQGCPLGQHPKMFKLNQEVKVDELKAQLNQLKQS